MAFTYKTLFIPSSEIKPKSAFSTALPEVNGDQLTRDVQAALVEMENEGYKLHSMSPVQSAKLYMSSFAYSYTDGILLIFEKIPA
ncbi:MAG: hypothetical protein ACK4TA_15105 [Saprospiraceae bacterium]